MTTAASRDRLCLGVPGISCRRVMFVATPSAALPISLKLTPRGSLPLFTGSLAFNFAHNRSKIASET